MGIRVHKFLGYGLADVQTKDMRITDERINPQSWLLTYDGTPSVEDYHAWLSQHQREFPSMDLWYCRDEKRDRRRELNHCAIWSPEYGMPEVLVLQPLGCPDWSRFDNSIDYIEETWLRPERQGNHVDLVGGGIYPWIGTYMDDRTGEAVDDKIMWWVRLCNSDEPDDEGRAEALDVLAQAAGLSGHEEAVAHVWPMVPDEVRDLAEFAELFTSDGTWRQLRPMLYTYWA